jgi:phosphatidylserine/phosphatidylglycerophosphate/cardiolipin synthase-like enzyme/uncharacterized membrane protein YdjX (TVP38/TMEM64 family)
VRAGRVAVLVDGAAYFGALRTALMNARRSIVIAGWDVDSRTPIIGTDTEPDDGAPVRLRDLLTHVVERSPELEAHILLWDFSMLYSLERETLPRVALDWSTPDRINVSLDDELPLGASAHQKIVVIDNAIAFVGGLDLTVNRWDTPEHLPEDDRRVSPSGERYPPFHDVQMLVDGDAALGIADLVTDRWQRATGERLELAEPDSDPWPDAVDPDLEDVPVAIARTIAAHRDDPGVHEIRRSYVETIAAAKRSIYIENQYLTSVVIADALKKRLQQNPELEVLVICPEAPGGWLEAKTMGLGLSRFIRLFDSDALQARIRFLQPVISCDGEPCDLMVHAKVMIIDDVLLRIGSSNLNNRSMGLDTECDLLAYAQTPEHRLAIARTRNALLAEHTGATTQEIARCIEESGSLLEAAGTSETGSRRLRKVRPADLPEDAFSVAIKDLADPEAPLDPADFLGDAFDAKRRSALRHRLLRLAIGGAVLLGLILLWHVTPLSRLTDADALNAHLAGWRQSSWTIPFLGLAFIAGSLLVFPITALILLCAVLLGPWQGFVCALTGSLAGAAVSYALGALLGAQVVDDLLGRFRHTVNRSLQNNGIAAAALLRVVPVAPFTVVNVMLGSSAIRFGDYMLGTLIGMTPGIALITLMGDRLREAWQDPSPANVALLALAILGWISIAIGLQFAARKFRKHH